MINHWIILVIAVILVLAQLIKTIMAKCNLSAKELTVDTFSPRVAVLCSPAAQTICDKNNLKFTQLIQPFTSFTTARKHFLFLSYHASVQNEQYSTHTFVNL